MHGQDLTPHYECPECGTEYTDKQAEISLYDCPFCDVELDALS